MKVEILKNAVAGGKIHAKGEIKDVEDKTAKTLIEREFAKPHKGPIPKTEGDTKDKGES